MLNVTVIAATEWEGMYFNDSLVHEDHIVSIRDLARQAVVPFTLKLKEATLNVENTIEQNGGFPKELSKIIW